MVLCTLQDINQAFDHVEIIIYIHLRHRKRLSSIFIPYLIYRQVFKYYMNLLLKGSAYSCIIILGIIGKSDNIRYVKVRHEKQ